MSTAKLGGVPDQWASQTSLSLGQQNQNPAYRGRSTESTARSASSEYSRSSSLKLLLGSASTFAHYSRNLKLQHCRLENWIPPSTGIKHRYLLLWPTKQGKTSHASDANTRRTADEHNVDAGSRLGCDKPTHNHDREQ